MPEVACLRNRYPEATLSTIVHEVQAVRGAAAPAVFDVRVLGMGVGAAFLDPPPVPMNPDGPVVCGPA